jgi:hypothetical protein
MTAEQNLSVGTGSGKAPTVGTALEVTCRTAAPVNGTATHGYELDDMHDASMSHAGARGYPGGDGRCRRHLRRRSYGSGRNRLGGDGVTSA